MCVCVCVVAVRAFACVCVSVWCLSMEDGLRLAHTYNGVRDINDDGIFPYHEFSYKFSHTTHVSRICNKNTKNTIVFMCSIRHE